jgi:hypothetical protein
MDSVGKGSRRRQRAAALVIVLAFVVLLLGLSVAYLSRTTGDRQVAHSSFHQSKVDELAQSAMDSIIGDLRQEITNGSTPSPQADLTTVYSPTPAANMVPQRSGNVAGVPNLIRRSVRSDSLANNPAPPSKASAVNSTADLSANGRYVNATRWNTHYLIPKKNTGTDDSIPIDAFGTGNPPATPDWVFLNSQGSTLITAPNNTIVGRYAYAIYDESGLLDTNVVGYPTDPSAAPTPTQRVGRKGSLAYADLTALGNYPILNPDASGVYQVDRLVGWRNYATTQPTNNFPVTSPPGQVFAKNFQTSTTPATSFYNFVVSNTSGFLNARSDVSFNSRTDQMFLGRTELIALRNTIGTTTSFSTNTLQYLSTFSREANSPSFSPSTPPGSTINYAALASTSTAVNPNFLLRRVTTSFTRFDGTTAVVGEPLVKTRFPLSRLAWITYKGPSASLATTDPVYTALVNAGVSTATIQAGTAANIKYCFGLTFPTGGTPGSAWTYTNPTGAAAANRILRLDEVATAAREPDFFELLQAAILSGSLGQNTGGGVTGGNVFPNEDSYMGSTTHHILSIGAAMIDQADSDSIPTRIQFNPSGTVWTAYGVENLPYINQLYPIAGANPAAPTKWSTYLLFQLWNPHQNAPATLAAPVRLRVDGGIGIFTGGNGETWNPSSSDFINTAGQSVMLNPSPSPAPSPAPFFTPAPLSTQNTSPSPAPAATPAPGAFGPLSTPAIPTPTP